MDIFKDIYNRATGVFDRIVDLEFKDLQLDLIRKANAAEAAKNAAQQPVNPAAVASTNTLLLIGGLAAGAVLLVVLLKD